MRGSIVVSVLLTALAFPAQANDGIEPSLRTKALASAGRAIDTPARDPMSQLVKLEEQVRPVGPQGGCEISARDVCYDLGDNRIVYRPARDYMPKVDGLKPENISLRHNRVVFKYSFR